jgi:N-acetylneuraminic acid mutarotase
MILLSVLQKNWARYNHYSNQINYVEENQHRRKNKIVNKFFYSKNASYFFNIYTFQISRFRFATTKTNGSSKTIIL